MTPDDEVAVRRVEDYLAAEDIEALWIVFHDYNGRACAKWIPRRYAGAALRRGGVFARANLNFTIDDQQVPQPRFGADTGDFFALPDPETVALLPYRPGAARILSYLTTEDGTLWEGCPRGRLNQATNRLANHDLSARTAFEPEFSLYKLDADGQPTPADNHAMYSVDRIDTHHAYLARIEHALALQNVNVIQVGSEYGAGQVELNLDHEPPLKSSDDLLTLRATARAIARDYGLVASFMPKPFTSAAGNGLHVHLSLWNTDGSEDRSTGDYEAGVSQDMRRFIAGVLTHAPAICGVAAPTVNSYKRLQPASWAPAHIAYGVGNRSALVRVPGSTRRRLEFRAGDHTANPYLLLAALIAAGIDGLERELAPGSAVADDLGYAERRSLEDRGIYFLPRTLNEALDAIERDEIVMDALGPVCGPELLRVKRYELARYETEVGDWERSVYFERV